MKIIKRLPSELYKFGLLIVELGFSEVFETIIEVVAWLVSFWKTDVSLYSLWILDVVWWFCSFMKDVDSKILVVGDIENFSSIFGVELCICCDIVEVLFDVVISIERICRLKNFVYDKRYTVRYCSYLIWICVVFNLVF
jgi:hypothetical protein